MNTVLTIEKVILNFLNEFDSHDIYNEISLQLELGIYLRNNLPTYKVQFERNIYDIVKKDDRIFAKSEIDIYLENETDRFAIELKYPVNGQYPEEMFEFLKDIKFMEQVVENAGFKKAYTLTVVNDHLFYEGDSSREPYKTFRNNGKIDIAANSEILKPTGKSKGEHGFNIKGEYHLKWEPIPNREQNDASKYYLAVIG